MTAPRRQSSIGLMAIAMIASLFSTRPVHAQEWLSWHGPAAPQRIDTPKDPPAATSPGGPAPHEAVAMPALPSRQQPVAEQHAVVAATAVGSAVLASAQSNPAAVIKPLSPTTGTPMVVAGAASSSHEGPNDDAAVDPDREATCDEISHCDQLEVVRSGVGIEAPADDATKRRPERATRRHVLQSVRSVW